MSRIITTVTHPAVAISGVPSIQPLGVLLTLPDGQVLDLNAFGLIPTRVEFRSTSNVSAEVSSNFFLYMYIFGALPFKAVLSGYIIRNVMQSGQNHLTLQNTSPLTFLIFLATKVAASYSFRPVILSLTSDLLEPTVDRLNIYGFLVDVGAQFEADENISGLGSFRLEILGIPPPPTP
jgi:hypothetical protein